MIYAFEVGLRRDAHRSTVNSTTLGKAKARFLNDIQDYWPETNFVDVVGRKVGPPHTSAAFLRTAKYRGMPDLRCGHEVLVEGNRGRVVGHNDSANFDVLFIGGRWKGFVLNCHPCDFDGPPAPPKDASGEVDSMAAPTQAAPSGDAA